MMVINFRDSPTETRPMTRRINYSKEPVSDNNQVMLYLYSDTALG